MMTIQSRAQRFAARLQDVERNFIRVSEADDLAVLEWQSRGELATGRPIECRGVSLVTHGEETAITRLAADFDTARPRTAWEHDDR